MLLLNGWRVIEDGEQDAHGSMVFITSQFSHFHFCFYLSTSHLGTPESFEFFSQDRLVPPPCVVSHDLELEGLGCNVNQPSVN